MKSGNRIILIGLIAFVVGAVLAYLVSAGVFAPDVFLPPSEADEVGSDSSQVTLSVELPSFTIENVVRDQTVTIEAQNFPPNQLYDVTMGPMYTQGINGIRVKVIDSGPAGSFRETFSIPDDLKGQDRISIRIQTHEDNSTYAFNWFWNYTCCVGDNGRVGAVFKVDWPEQVTQNTSGVVRLDYLDPELLPLPVQTVYEDANDTTNVTTGRMQTFATPLPVGTPQAVPIQAYGSDMKLCINAEMESAAFNIAQVPEDCQFVDSSDLIWEWSVMPVNSNIQGEHSLIARVEAQWITEDGEIEAKKEIWREHIVTNVKRPWLVIGQISVLTMFSGLFLGLIGTALKFPVVEDFIEGRRKENVQSENESD